MKVKMLQSEAHREFDCCQNFGTQDVVGNARGKNRKQPRPELHGAK
jgi:hypothetical protein